MCAKYLQRLAKIEQINMPFSNNSIQYKYGEKFYALISESPVFWVRRDGSVFSISGRIEQDFGYQASAVTNISFFNFFEIDDQIEIESNFYAQQSREIFSLSGRFVACTGQIHWVECVGFTSFEVTNDAGAFPIILLTDKPSDSVDKSIGFAGRILDSTRNEIYIVDAKALTVESANRSALRNLGYTAEEIDGIALSELNCELSHDALKVRLEPIINGRLDRVVFETSHQRHDESTYPVEIEAYFDLHDGKRYLIIIATDISEKNDYLQKVQYLAYHDSLTGLFNRRAILEYLEQAIVNNARAGHEFFLLYVDLKTFKDVNDGLGHSVGDYVLSEVASRFTNNFNADRKTKVTFSRVGGDEFLVVIEGIFIRNVVSIIEAIQSLIRLPVKYKGRMISVDSNAGVAVYPKDGLELESLLMNSDMAMYRAKKGNKNYIFYEDHFGAEAKRLSIVSERLRLALNEGSMHIVFQPIVMMNTKEIRGVEILLRWNDPVLGAVSPTEIVNVALADGIMGEVTAWILDTLYEKLPLWSSDNLISDLFLSINFEAEDVENQVLNEKVSDFAIFARTFGVSVDIEITERCAIQNIDSILGKMNNLMAKGISFSVDDFGADYSSLSRLGELNPSKVKIDRSFVESLESGNKWRRAILEAIAFLTAKFEIDVIVEGIETEAQYNEVKNMGFKYGQGYLFSKPLPEVELLAQLRCGRILEPSH